MGKGYNNYMCKKPFHPGSKANIKRTWMAEQKTENEKRKQEDLKSQYDKEQDLYNNRALISKESKDKLGLNFMYEAPPGAKKERQKEDDEPEYKFEWQRKYNAPREDFAKGNQDIRDQPFGIQVRNVRCIKCHKWGHINTDKECPLYNKASTADNSATSMDPLQLMEMMKEEEGLALKQTILGHRVTSTLPNQQLIASDTEEDAEVEFLKSLSTKQKRKLLRKLERLEKKDKKSKDKKKKHKKHSSDDDNDRNGSKKKKRKRKLSSGSREDSPQEMKNGSQRPRSEETSTPHSRCEDGPPSKHRKLHDGYSGLRKSHSSKSDDKRPRHRK